MLDPAHLQTLVSSLADAASRRDAARQLATAVGATDLYVFVQAATGGKLLPAAGFLPSLPSSRGWRELLARGLVTGVHHGDVAYPTADATAAATALAFPKLCLVFVYGERAPAAVAADRNAAAAADRNAAIAADRSAAVTADRSAAVTADRSAAVDADRSAAVDADPCAAIAADLHAAIARHAPLLAALLGVETELRGVRGQLAAERQASEQAAALARALDLARAESERATRVKDEFLAMLGHELRNPLAPIVTALQLLRLDGVHTHAQDVIERQVAHVTRLVDDLLDVSRIASGKIELRKQPIELTDVVQRAIEMARPLLEARQSRISIDVAAAGLLVDGDPARLAQIVANLVTNAAKYSDLGAPIWISAQHDGTAVRITVADVGKGIPHDYLERIFDRFVQTPQGIDRGDGGLGLGLAIVKSLAELHGGRVTAHSDGPGRGSRFVVDLPPCVAATAAADHVIATAPVAPASSLGARVLVVDDNVDAAELLAEILTTFGHDVHVANDGLEALAALASFTPDAALLDIGLPAMDGYELARRLRDTLPEIRLVALTGYGRPDDRRRTTEAGFDAHLVKPVSIRRVTDTLDKLLGERATSPVAIDLEDLTPIPVLVATPSVSRRN